MTGLSQQNIFYGPTTHARGKTIKAKGVFSVDKVLLAFSDLNKRRVFGREWQMITRICLIGESEVKYWRRSSVKWSDQGSFAWGYDESCALCYDKYHEQGFFRAAKSITT